VKNNQGLHKGRETEELEKRHKLNVVRKFYRKISEARNGFKPRINMRTAKDGTVLE
jgi:hypothetical protein